MRVPPYPLLVHPGEDGTFQDLVGRRRAGRDCSSGGTSMIPATATSFSTSEPVLNTQCRTPGRFKTGGARANRVTPTAEFQLPPAADHVVNLLTAVPVQRSVVAGANFDDAEAKARTIEASLGIDQLQIPDRSVGSLHRRASEVLGGVDDDPCPLQEPIHLRSSCLPCPGRTVCLGTKILSLTFFGCLAALRIYMMCWLLHS